MNSNFVLDAQARRLVLAAGASQQLVLRAGATVVCVDGSVRIDEPATGPEAAGGLPRAVSVRVNAGEGHGLAYGGVARITAIGRAEVLCLDRPALAHRLLGRASDFFRRKMAETRKNPVGALHKISK
ncbi:hypothetical protein JL37_29605 [Achromobacter sp. RTa]|uniref:hypothetical protein n=1 Tax=Achromobacter sp. RTa TaxID=1532557 RepID=UPI00050E4607|nr:hypothetical protein [Achromobacter sp. RTa]KGD85610.1 hypothetical protein JL37_29605 [Achromobacter sp. RTa]